MVSVDNEGIQSVLNFKYNVDGIRTEKKVVKGQDTVTTKYHLVGDKVTFEDNGTDKIYYTYDAESNLVSMNLNGTEYYYMRNAQGDIIGLYDKSGTQVVSYVYDSWGKVISTTGTLASTVGEKNTYRYRGYRYDTETGLYYLQSRYYNPEWGRFINADGIIGQTGELLGHNLFSYCKNNTINFSDPTGFYRVFADEESQEEYEAYIHGNLESGRVEVVPTIGLGNLSGTVTGTALGYAGSKTKEVAGYIDDGIIRSFPNTSIIKPYEKIAGRASKAITVITAAFDIANTWDSSSKLTFGQKMGKTALQLGGLGAAIAFGTIVSGYIITGAMATGGWMAVTGGFLGAGLADYTAGSFISWGQSKAYKKYGLE